jgi:hypothetical protein
LFPCPHSSLICRISDRLTGWEEGEARNPTEGEEGKGGGEGETHAIQMGRDISVGVDEGLVAADLDDLPDDNDILPHV